MCDRSDVIRGLRDLADMLAKYTVIPTPRVLVTASMPPDHGFTDVLALVEALAPCTVEESVVDSKRDVVRRMGGGVDVYVTVDTRAVGEVRPVNRHIPTFFVDTEVIKAGQMEMA